ncbi:MAG: HipA N-terminal domain-containing protein [Bacteroidota bacterium]
MRKAKVFVQGCYAGELIEDEKGHSYRFTYDEGYTGPPVSLTMPVKQKTFSYDRFPPFFDGLLPEGMQLEGLLKRAKIDRNDLLSQLLKVGLDLVGAVTVEEKVEGTSGSINTK